MEIQNKEEAESPSRNNRQNRNPAIPEIAVSSPSPLRIPIRQRSPQNAIRARESTRSIVDEILAQDQNAPTKQRHTATQIFRRLVAEHGYTGSYHPIQRHLQAKPNRTA
jgi:hypothetical protein